MGVAVWPKDADLIEINGTDPRTNQMQTMVLSKTLIDRLIAELQRAQQQAPSLGEHVESFRNTLRAHGFDQDVIDSTLTIGNEEKGEAK